MLSLVADRPAHCAGPLMQLPLIERLTRPPAHGSQAVYFKWTTNWLSVGRSLPGPGQFRGIFLRSTHPSSSGKEPGQERISQFQAGPVELTLLSVSYRHAATLTKFGGFRKGATG